MTINPYEPPSNAGEIPAARPFRNGGGKAFKVFLKSTPANSAKGQFQCEVGPDGLLLTRGKKQQITVPVGATSQYLGKSRFMVQLPEQRLEITVSKFGSYQYRLARDLAAFVNRTGPMPAVDDYGLEWYFYLVSVLPLGVPILSLGGAIPCVIGFGAAGACFGIAQKEDWPTPVRIMAALALTVGAYLALFALIVAIGLVRGAARH